jgi:hypothetical protein
MNHTLAPQHDRRITTMHTTQNLWKTVTLMTLAMAFSMVAGCGDASPNADHADLEARGAETSPSSSTTANAQVPDGFFLEVAPAGAVPLRDAKNSASVGDRVVLEARIGGRAEPFTESAAVFLIADPSLPNCAELHGDGCPTPWDYCCEPKDSLMKNLATVQIVDDAGRPLRGSVRGVHGLDPLARIIVVGTVRASDGPTFVIDASEIHVIAG